MSPGIRIGIALVGFWVLAAQAVRADAGEDLYRDGHYEQAIAWWRNAATTGAANAAYRLGVVYADGVVVAQDHAEAARWLRASAEKGDPRAQFDLATLYDNGLGVERSHARAAKWYRAAAEQGDAASQHNLGAMYEQGHGVERDLVEAYKWYALAAEAGFPVERLGALERLSKAMSAAQIQRGIEAARNFDASR